MKKITLAVLFICLGLGLTGCASWNPCGCGGKKCAAQKAEMKCAKCDTTGKECKCPKEATCTKCNMPKSKCKCM